ncbi:histidine phosphatase family protein [Halomonas sp. MCCC 1A11036]|uniref:Histidine phosphatase family protein n=1 Tax=Billgrantia zhangzhouensis TaxID=2733481 RepID=A0ABS9AGX1_9GAMM|nr:histidine phosphatase family protein [Halomonas zhangzhouensis]MCE8020918.1 histidine phosphatase family protein [Halomonas zhangzhouensis]
MPQPLNGSTLHLIRHGQTTGDIENRFGGAYDDYLTDLGKEQSRQVAQDLNNSPLSMVYSSSLNRALETADIIADCLDVPRGVLPEFRECNRYGILSGMTKHEAQQHHPQEVAKLKGLEDTVTGAESYRDFKQRVTAAFERLFNDGSKGEIALVTHGGVFRLLFRDILRLGEFSIGDCARVTLWYDQKGIGVIEQHGINVK